MNPYAPRTRLLIALFDLTQASEMIDLYSLAEEAGLNLYRTLSELHTLSLSGFVDARRLRLTASGLTLAVALNARLRANVEAVKPVARVVAVRRAAAERPKHSFERAPLDAGGQQPQGSIRDLFQRDLVA